MKVPASGAARFCTVRAQLSRLTQDAGDTGVKRKLIFRFFSSYDKEGPGAARG